MVGELGRYFLAIGPVIEKIRDPRQLEFFLKPLIDSYNQKELTEKFGDSTLFLPEHEEDMMMTQEKFIHLNATLMTALKKHSEIPEEEIGKIQKSASEIANFYHRLREEVRK